MENMRSSIPATLEQAGAGETRNPVPQAGFRQSLLSPVEAQEGEPPSGISGEQAYAWENDFTLSRFTATPEEAKVHFLMEDHGDEEEQSKAFARYMENIARQRGGPVVVLIEHSEAFMNHVGKLDEIPDSFIQHLSPDIRSQSLVFKGWDSQEIRDNISLRRDQVAVLEQKVATFPEQYAKKLKDAKERLKKLEIDDRNKCMLNALSQAMKEGKHRETEAMEEDKHREAKAFIVVGGKEHFSKEAMPDENLPSDKYVLMEPKHFQDPATSQKKYAAMIVDNRCRFLEALKTPRTPEGSEGRDDLSSHFLT